MNPLLLIVLYIIACTSVISALSQHGHGDSVVDTPVAAFNGESNVRTLKQNATVLRRGESLELEDRSYINLMFNRFMRGLIHRILNILYQRRLDLTIETPASAFTVLKLDSKKDKLFGSAGFGVWINHVREKYPASAGDEIIKVLNDHNYPPDVLAPLLLKAVAIPEQRKIAADIYHDLLSSWSGLESEAVFMRLKLNEIPDEPNVESIVESIVERMAIWLGFLSKKYGDSREEVYLEKLASLPVVTSATGNSRELLAAALDVSISAQYLNFELSLKSI